MNSSQDSQIAQQIYDALKAGQITDRQVYDAAVKGEIPEGAVILLNEGLDFSRFAADDLVEQYKNQVTNK